MIFNQGSVRTHWCAIDRLNHLHGMRITHRHHTDFQRFISHIKAIDHDIVVMQKRDFTRQKPGNTHVNRNHSVGFKAWSNDPFLRFDANFPLVGQSDVVHKSDKAACPVATLLDLAAICVKNSVTEIDIGPGRFFNQQNLIATHTEIAVGQQTKLGRGQGYLLANAIKDNEVVAQTMHF